MIARTVCVTGGAGFIGSHVADALLARGHRVVIVDDLSSGRKENLPAAAEFHQLDIRSPEAAALIADAGVEVLVHHAAQMDVRRSVADPVNDASINVLGTLNLLEAGRKAALRQVVFASTGGAMYGEQERFPADETHPARPLSPYGVAKLAVERYLYFFHREYGLDAVALRYANVYGPRQNPHGEAGVVAIFLDRLLSGQARRRSTATASRPATTSSSPTSSPPTLRSSDARGSRSSTWVPAARARSSSSTIASPEPSASTAPPSTGRPRRASNAGR